MQTKNRNLVIAFFGYFGLFLAGLALLLFLLLWTALPIKLLELFLQGQGHEAKNFSMRIHSFRERTLEIGILQIEDENKKIAIRNLVLRLSPHGVETLQADEISFRDMTKPNHSLKTVLQNWPKTEGPQRHCINELSIKKLLMAPSFSSQNFQINDLSGKKICLGIDLQYEDLNFSSEDFTIKPERLLWKVNHNHFFDLTQETIIEFQMYSNSLGLTPLNLNALNKMFK